MKNKALSSLIVIFSCCLMLNVPVAKSCIPYYSWVFSEEIVPGAVFEWQIKNLEAEGGMENYSSHFLLGQKTLDQGDIITLEVIREPDGFNNYYSYDDDYYNLSLNGVNIVNKKFSFASEFKAYLGKNLIEPIGREDWDEYTNVFEEELDGKTSTETIFDGHQTTYTSWYTVYEDNSLFMIRKSIQNGIYTQEMLYNDYYHALGSDDETLEKIDVVVKTSYDVSSGVMQKNELVIEYENLEVEDNITLLEEYGYLHFLMSTDVENPSKTLTFGIFGLFSIFIIGIVLVKKRKI